MRNLPKPVVFEWDKGNTEKNFKKHGITNKEAEEVFSNEPFFISEDPEHSKRELRFQALGKTNNEKLLFLSFTIRKNKVRIISARDMSRKERRVYEEKAEKNTKI